MVSKGKNRVGAGAGAGAGVGAGIVGIGADVGADAGADVGADVGAVGVGSVVFASSLPALVAHRLQRTVPGRTNEESFEAGLIVRNLMVRCLFWNTLQRWH